MNNEDPHTKKRKRAASYKVGYGHPPIETQFKVNTSGNPSGRPKKEKAVDIRPDLLKVYLQNFRVGDGGAKRNMPAIVVLHEFLLRKAMKRDVKAAALVTKFAKELGVLNYKEEKAADFSSLTEDERTLLNKAWPIIQKIKASRAK